MTMFERNRFAPSTDTAAGWTPHHRDGAHPTGPGLLVTVRSDDGETMTGRADALAWNCDEPGGRIAAWRPASPADVLDYLRDAEPVNTAGLTLTGGAWVPHGGDCRPVDAAAAVEIAAVSGETQAGLADRFAWGQAVPEVGRVVAWRALAAPAILSAMR